MGASIAHAKDALALRGGGHAQDGDIIYGKTGLLKNAINLNKTIKPAMLSSPFTQVQFPPCGETGHRSLVTLKTFANPAGFDSSTLLAEALKAYGRWTSVAAEKYTTVPIITCAYRGSSQGGDRRDYGRGQRPPARGRESRDGSAHPAGRKGKGKTKGELIKAYVDEFGVARCDGLCDICYGQASPDRSVSWPGHRCCHWDGHRYPPLDWLPCDCIAKVPIKVRLEDELESPAYLDKGDRVEVDKVHVTAARVSKDRFNSVSHPTMLLSGRARDKHGATGWFIVQVKTQLMDEWSVSFTGRNASMDIGHVHQCRHCYNAGAGEGNLLGERDYPPGRPPKSRPPQGHKRARTEARSSQAGPRTDSTGESQRHQLSAFRPQTAADLEDQRTPEERNS